MRQLTSIEAEYRTNYSSTQLKQAIDEALSTRDKEWIEAVERYKYKEVYYRNRIIIYWDDWLALKSKMTGGK